MTISLAQIFSLQIEGVFYWFIVKISGNHCTISWQLFSLHDEPDTRSGGVY